MDAHSHGIPTPSGDLRTAHALGGRVLVTSAVFLLLLFLLAVGFHLYSRLSTRRPSPTRLRLRLSLPTRGLDSAAVAAIPTFVCSSAEKPPECAVCLSEFEEGEVGRVLPTCAHGFHVECIDTWLRTRSTCPVCREPVLGGPPVGVGPRSGSASEVNASAVDECRRKPPELAGIVVESGSG